MRKLITLAVCALWAMSMTAQTRNVKVVVSNDCDMDKVDEPVVVSLKDVKKLAFCPEGAVVKDGEKVVPCQLDDMDGDLRADELFFLVNMKAKETKTFEVVLSKEPVESKVESRIYTALQIRDKKDLHPDVRMVEADAETNIFNDIYMHGMTIESELVGYRIYFDKRQNIDLYGKKLRRIELPVTQFYTSEEQIAQGYGVDVLWAGQAIGCGSFKRYKDGKPANWEGDIKVRSQRVVTTGPLRTVVELADRGIADGEGMYDIHQYYSLYAGHRDVKVDVLFSNATQQKFCTGVQKVGVTATDEVRRGHKSEGMIREDGIVASWGCDYPDMNEAKKLIWGPEPIGMAVYMPTKYIFDSEEDELNYVYGVQPKDKAIHYWLSFCAAKEEVGYHNASEWFGSMDEWKKNVENPVKLKIKN